MFFFLSLLRPRLIMQDRLIIESLNVADSFDKYEDKGVLLFHCA